MDYMNPGKFWYTKLKEQTDTEGKPSGKGNKCYYSWASSMLVLCFFDTYIQFPGWALFPKLGIIWPEE